MSQADSSPKVGLLLLASATVRAGVERIDLDGLVAV